MPGDTINQSIQFDCTSTAESLIRVKIEPTWEGDLPSENIELVYGDGVTVTKTINKGQRGYWYQCDDGYFYYMDSIKSKNGIDLVKGIKFNGGTKSIDANEYQNKNLNITVTMDIIQSKYAPFKTKWSISDKNLSDELIELCPESNKDA